MNIPELPSDLELINFAESEYKHLELKNHDDFISKQIGFSDGAQYVLSKYAKKYRDALVLAVKALEQYGGAVVYVGEANQNESVALNAIKKIEEIFK